jgi:hypothetical protein
MGLVRDRLALLLLSPMPGAAGRLGDGPAAAITA